MVTRSFGERDQACRGLIRNLLDLNDPYFVLMVAVGVVYCAAGVTVLILYPKEAIVGLIVCVCSVIYIFIYDV